MAGQMLVGAVVPRIQYEADGWQTEFPFPFVIFKAGDLQVFIDEALRASQGGGYTVDGVASNDGGTVVFSTPPPNGARITLRRKLTLERLTNFQDGGAFRARVLNDQLDFLTAALQELEAQLDRAAVKAPTADDPVSVTLPPAVAGKAIGWSDDGLSLVNDPTDFTTTVQVVQQWATDAEGSVQAAHDSADAAAASEAAAADSAQAASASATTAQEGAATSTQAAATATTAAGTATTARIQAEAFAADAAFTAWVTGREREDATAAAQAAADDADLAAERATAALLRAEDIDVALWRAERAARRAETAATTSGYAVTGISASTTLPNWARIDT